MARYFMFVGGALLVLLMISNAYLPKAPVADRTDFKPPVVLIHSDRKWPERVVYDTGLATIVPPQVETIVPPPVEKTEAKVPVMRADASPDTRARETLARLQPSDAKQLQLSDAKKRERLQHQRKIAKRRAALLRGPPRFGFDNYIWWTE
ncbi:MAG: hypothetical protein HY852_27170 [Bradyrhizobium sp.]|nr:hypothetical protein [Bradyrhizobium sp.]